MRFIMALANWEKFKRYGENDIEYKDQARALLTEALGFEPPIQFSLMGEVAIRKTLREIANGEDNQRILENKIELYSESIRRMIPEYAPEYNHLLK